MTGPLSSSMLSSSWRGRGYACSMEYRELPADRALADDVACLWYDDRVRSPAQHRSQLVLPDGCIDIVWIRGHSLTIAGPATSPVQADLPPEAAVLGLRFRIGRAPAYLGVPADVLLNADVPLRAIWGDAADRLRDHPGVHVDCRRRAGGAPDRRGKPPCSSGRRARPGRAASAAAFTTQPGARPGRRVRTQRTTTPAPLHGVGRVRPAHPRPRAALSPVPRAARRSARRPL